MTVDLLDELVEQVAATLDARDGIDPTLGPWREDPVDFDTFCLAKEHLALPPLYPRQRAAVLALIGEDPKLTFADPITAGKEWKRVYQMAVLLWGKGSGKDYVCSVLVCYLIHILLCLRDPQAFLEQAPGENIDVLNVAYNADQAKRVFFTKLKARIDRWPWLANNYAIIDAGRKRARPSDANTSRGDVVINDDMVEFPGGIRAWSRHAQNESYEGLNVIVWIMDEASAFLSKTKRENAEAIYQTLKTSAASRFGLRWAGLIISYPRHADDFTMTKHREAEANPDLGTYPDGPAKTWEVNERTRNEPRVVVRDMEVPASLANDFNADFEESLSRYCCEPPAARDAFFRFPQRISDAIDAGRKPLIEWEPIVIARDDVDGTHRKYRGVRLTKLGKLPKGSKLYFHGDPGLVNDSFALAIGHAVPATVLVTVPAGEVLDAQGLHARGLQPGDPVEWEREVVRTIIDALIVWRPDARKQLQVDLQNVEDTLMALRDTYPSLGHKGRRTKGEAAPRPTGTFDHWNSALTIQRMRARGMNVEDESWSRGFQVDIFRNARTAFYNSLVTLPDTPSITSRDPSHPGAVYELERIEFIDAVKVDHPQGGSKDSADAVVRVIQHATEHNRAAFAFGSAAGHKSRYGQHAPLAPSMTPKINPHNPPKMANPANVEAEEAARLSRPLGELVPSEGTADGRRLAFGTLTTRKQ